MQDILSGSGVVRSNCELDVEPVGEAIEAFQWAKEKTESTQHNEAIQWLKQHIPLPKYCAYKDADNPLVSATLNVQGHIISGAIGDVIVAQDARHMTAYVTLIAVVYELKKTCGGSGHVAQADAELLAGC